MVESSKTQDFNDSDNKFGKKSLSSVITSQIPDETLKVDLIPNWNCVLY